MTEVYHKRQIERSSGGPADERLLYDSSDFNELHTTFETLHWFEGEVWRHEGTHHYGPSEVIQFVGRRK